MSHGRNENSDAQSHDRNLASANNSFRKFYLNHGVKARRTDQIESREEICIPISLWVCIRFYIANLHTQSILYLGQSCIFPSLVCSFDNLLRGRLGSRR